MQVNGIAYVEIIFLETLGMLCSASFDSLANLMYKRNLFHNTFCAADVGHTFIVMLIFCFWLSIQFI